MRKYFAALAALVAFTVVATGCETGTTDASQKAEERAGQLNKRVYLPQNNIEFENYNDRQRLADDPATIIWCTFFPPSNAQQPVTVPIAGKLTSSGKRPYDDVKYNDTYGTMNVPGPDAMFGSSSEYRYGFDPTRTIYYDFTQMPSLCTNTPLVWQRNETRVAIATDSTLNSFTREAEAALKRGDAKAALKALQGAETKG